MLTLPFTLVTIMNTIKAIIVMFALSSVWVPDLSERCTELFTLDEDLSEALVFPNHTLIGCIICQVALIDYESSLVPWTLNDISDRDRDRKGMDKICFWKYGNRRQMLRSLIWLKNLGAIFTKDLWGFHGCYQDKNGGVLIFNCKNMGGENGNWCV